MRRIAAALAVVVASAMSFVAAAAHGYSSPRFQPVSIAFSSDDAHRLDQP
jgi:hypothetical protein